MFHGSLYAIKHTVIFLPFNTIHADPEVPISVILPTEFKGNFLGVFNWYSSFSKSNCPYSELPQPNTSPWSKNNSYNN